MRGFYSAPAFNAPQGLKKFWGGNGIDRFFPDNWEDIIHKAGQYFIPMAFDPGVFLFAVPFPAYNFKAVGDLGPYGLLDGLPVRAGVNAEGYLFFGLFATLASFLEADGGIHTQRKKFFLSSKAVF